MPTKFQFEQWVPFPLEQVFLFFAQPENLPRIMPPKLATRIETLKRITPVIPSKAEGPSVAEALAGVGSEITTSFRIVPYLSYRAAWVALITEFDWNHHFADIQKQGPFRSFHHRHQLTPEVRNGVNGTLVTDVINLELGFGSLGKLVERIIIRRQMEQTFRHRQNVLPHLLAEDYRDGSTKTAVP